MAHCTVQPQVRDRIHEKFGIGKRRRRLWGGGRVGLLLLVSKEITFKRSRLERKLDLRLGLFRSMEKMCGVMTLKFPSS